MRKIFIVVLLLSATAVRSFAQETSRWKTLPEVPAMPKADRSGMAPINGVQLYYAVFNNAGTDPVILLHGGFTSSDDWAFEVPLLVGKHKVIVMDTRGHGRSSMDNQPFSYEMFASDVHSLLAFLHVQQASIVGWSDGGITGLVIAMKYPGQVNKLFTYGSNYNKSGEKSAPFDTALAAKFMNRAKENYRKLSPTPGEFANFRNATIQMYNSQPNLDTVAMADIHIPVIIACGEYEQFYKREHFESMVKLIPGARLVVLPAVSHGGPLQDPAIFHSAVSSLLDN